MPVGDRQRMTEAMRRVLGDDQLAKSFSVEGFKLRDTISIAEITKKWVKVMHDYAD